MLIVPEEMAPTPEHVIGELEQALEDIENEKYQETYLETREEVEEEPEVVEPDSTDMPVVDLA